MFPNKLKTGDEIRVISPARSMELISQGIKDAAAKRLKSLGFKVSFSKNAGESDEFMSSSIKSRVDDMEEAFLDKNVKGILTTIGGYNSNQLLKYIDYNIIKSNPKVFCGFSDITALSNAILRKTGLITYNGPHFSTFGMSTGLEYTVECFKKCLMQDKPFAVEASEEWSDDRWYFNQKNRKFIANRGFKVINEGDAEGTIIGGNLCTLNLLQGTEFMPDLTDSILFVEDDDASKPEDFDRDLQSVIHLPGFKGVKSVIIGRFQKKSKMRQKLLDRIIKTKEELDSIPVISGVDFGHTTPQITFPIGGKARVSAHKGKVILEILEH